MGERLIKFFSGYGSYHTHPVNKLIHILCIPLIMSTLLFFIFEANVVLVNIKEPINVSIDLALLFLIVVSCVYIYVDYVSGVISMTIYYTIFQIMTNYYKSLDPFHKE